MVSRIVANQIFAHRGAWRGTIASGNSDGALLRAAREGFGIETDIRDFAGKVVVSHDPVPSGAAPSTLLEFLRSPNGPSVHQSPLALNVKSDGLSHVLLKNTESSMELPSKSFFFDMSIPETLRYSKANLPFAVRVSEYEPVTTIQEIRWPSKPVATWVDGFHGEWFLDDGGEWLLRRTEQGLVTIVSPELHARDSSRVMDWFLENASEYPNLTICTDLPWEYLDA